MATEIVLQKTASGALVPVDQDGADFIAKIKVGAGIRVSAVRQRNLMFLRKFFALLNFAFDSWEPDAPTYKGQIAAKNFERFRADIIILAGYYTTTVNLRGEVRLEAKSISFANMSEDDFSSLYNSVIDVILARVLTNFTKQQVDDTVAQLLAFS